jgi:hypothetical protein
LAFLQTANPEIGVPGKINHGNNPYTSSSVCVPTYTFPLATVGTVNFTASPAVSRDATAIALLYISFERLFGSYARRIAGAFGVASAPLESINHKMAELVALVDPFQEITGVAPCGPSVSGDWEMDGEEARIPADIGNDMRFP